MDSSEKIINFSDEPQKTGPRLINYNSLLKMHAHDCSQISEERAFYILD